jgi:hypothetical protein
MSDGIPNESALAQAEETAAALPNLDDPNESPDESEHDPDDPNDERNWPDAGDPSDHLNEANDRAAAVLRAAAEAREPEWDWRSDDEVLAIREQPLTGVWLNPSNAIVIMQDRPGEDEPEAFVFIRPESVPMLIRKMALACTGYQWRDKSGIAGTVGVEATLLEAEERPLWGRTMSGARDGHRSVPEPFRSALA